jgi:hypothetical protein
VRNDADVVERYRIAIAAGALQIVAFEANKHIIFAFFQHCSEF